MLCSDILVSTAGPGSTTVRHIYVVVKVVSRRQAAHEARVLKAVSVRPEARAIQVLAQIPVNGPNDDVGLVTPHCSGGHLFEGAASLGDVLRQAVQLCEVR